MGAIQVVFILLNLTIPYWLWTSRSSADLPEVQWEVLGRNFTRLADAGGGFAPCNPQDLKDEMERLCRNSQQNFTKEKSSVQQISAKAFTMTCEVKKDHLAMNWRPDQVEDPDLECQPQKPYLSRYAPTFFFNLKGVMVAIEYNNPLGVRERVKIKNCRQKLADLTAQSPAPNSISTYVKNLKRQADDPKSNGVAARVCLAYDIAPKWNSWRATLEETAAAEAPLSSQDPEISE